jgi:ethanolaminephosphotransferase
LFTLFIFYLLFCDDPHFFLFCRNLLGQVLNYITDPLYRKWVLYFPTWVAPNLITLTGLGFTAAAHIILMYYCPKMKGEVPQWVHFFAAFAVLAYQAFDAMDGKQARRTGSGSPLGMLFDHGCDAINTTIITMNVCCALQLGNGYGAIQLWCMAGIGFFAQTLEEYYTGEMHLPIYQRPQRGFARSGSHSYHCWVRVHQVLDQPG